MLRKRWFYYLIGAMGGGLLSAGLSLWGVRPRNLLSIPCAVLLVWWAERRGLVPSREEEMRLITLFPKTDRDDYSKPNAKPIG